MERPWFAFLAWIHLLSQLARLCFALLCLAWLGMLGFAMLMCVPTYVSPSNPILRSVATAASLMLGASPSKIVDGSFSRSPPRRYPVYESPAKGGSPNATASPAGGRWRYTEGELFPGRFLSFLLGSSLNHLALSLSPRPAANRVLSKTIWKRDGQALNVGLLVRS